MAFPHCPGVGGMGLGESTVSLHGRGDNSHLPLLIETPVTVASEDVRKAAEESVEELARQD